MPKIRLEKQQPLPVDDATKEAIEKAQEQARRGELISEEQVKINVRKKSRAWLKAQKEALNA